MSAEVIDGKRIGIISDTHGSAAAWKSALEMFGSVSVILHAGDVTHHSYFGSYVDDEITREMNGFRGKVFAVRGNCDMPEDENLLTSGLPLCVTLSWNGRVIVMMHGDNMPLLKRTARAEGASIVISGHTHVAKVFREDGMLFINPGSAARPLGSEAASAAVVDGEGAAVKTFDGKVLFHETW